MPSPASSSRLDSTATLVIGAAAAVLALVSGVGACGSGAQCALDSDCPLGLRCNAENQCVERGVAGTDAGEPDEEDTGPRADAGTDAGPPPTDAAIDADLDAVVMVDAYTDDAPMDDADLDAPVDAFDPCPALAPTYNVARVGLGCMTSASMVMFMRRPGECAYDVTSDRRDDFAGTVRLEMGMLSGGINFPDLGRVCTVRPFTGAAAVTCLDGCSIDLMVPPAP